MSDLQKKKSAKELFSKYWPTFTVGVVLLLLSCMGAFLWFFSGNASVPTDKPLPLDAIGFLDMWRNTPLDPRWASSIMTVAGSASVLGIAAIVWANWPSEEEKSSSEKKLADKKEKKQTVLEAVSFVFMAAGLVLAGSLEFAGYVFYHTQIQDLTPFTFIMLGGIYALGILILIAGGKTFVSITKSTAVVWSLVGVFAAAPAVVVFILVQNPLPSGKTMFFGTITDNCSFNPDTMKVDKNSCNIGPGTILVPGYFDEKGSKVNVMAWKKFDGDAWLHERARSCAVVSNDLRTIERDQWCQIEIEAKKQTGLKDMTREQLKKHGLNVCSESEKATVRKRMESGDPPCHALPTGESMILGAAGSASKAASQATTIDRMKCEKKEVAGKGEPASRNKWKSGWRSAGINLGALKPGEKFYFGICGFNLYSDGIRPDRKKQQVKFWYDNPHSPFSGEQDPFAEAPMTSAGVQVFQVPSSASDWVGGEHVYARIGIPDIVVFGPVDGCTVTDLAEVCGNGTDMFLRHVHEVDAPVGEVIPLEEPAVAPGDTTPGLRPYSGN